MRSIVMTIAAVIAFGLPVQAQLEDKVADRLWSASTVLDELVKAPDGGIPKDFMKRAQCIAVIPEMKKAALGVGGNYGRGAVSCKKDGGKGPWGPPSMISISGGSFGVQLGGQSIDVVRLFMSSGSV